MEVDQGLHDDSGTRISFTDKKKQVKCIMEILKEKKKIKVYITQKKVQHK